MAIRKIFVRVWQDHPDPPAGVPPDWPVITHYCEDADPDPPDGGIQWMEFATVADYDAYKAQRQAAYDAWAATYTP